MNTPSTLAIAAPTSIPVLTSNAASSAFCSTFLRSSLMAFRSSCESFVFSSAVISRNVAFVSFSNFAFAFATAVLDAREGLALFASAEDAMNNRLSRHKAAIRVVPIHFMADIIFLSATADLLEEDHFAACLLNYSTFFSTVLNNSISLMAKPWTEYKSAHKKRAVVCIY